MEKFPLMHGLETERLRFRTLTTADIDPWMDFISSPEAMEFFYMMETGSREACETWIHRQLTRYETAGHGLMAIHDKASGDLVGQVGLLRQVVDEESQLEIGYSMLPAYWGKGYAPEAAKACRDFAFGKNMAPYIISIIHVDNVNSQQVARKNGMSVWKRTTYMDLPVDVWRIDRETWLGMIENPG